MTPRDDFPAVPAPDTASVPGGLATLEKAAGEAAAGRGPAPVDRWDPPYCGDLDIRIAADGSWHYLGTPIGRERLVRLFASMLRRDADGRHYLVTPVEKIGIDVEDAPFLAVDLAVEGEGRDQRIGLRTNVDDFVVVDESHPLRFEVERGSGGLKPYVLVRGRLEALATRTVMHELVGHGREHELGGCRMVGVWSCGTFFPMAAAGDANRAGAA